MDERLSKDSVPLAETPVCHVRLSRDSRWPWILLIPKRSDLCELHDCSPDEQQGLLDAASRVSSVMKQQLGCTSVNIAMLGNVVSQLHCHVVARFEGDPNWPAPIWGFEQAVPYPDESLPDFALAVRAALL